MNMNAKESKWGRCFVCGKVLRGPGINVQVIDEDQRPWVGPECAKKIKKAGAAGYQPPSGGPRLRWI